MGIPARTAAAGLAATALFGIAPPAPPAGAAVIANDWPTRPGDGLRASTLPNAEDAADLSVSPDNAGGLFLAWTEQNGSILRLQHVDASGTPAFGVNGVSVRTGAGLDIGPAGSRRAADARGRFDLFTTSDSGVVVAWLEDGVVGRDLRVQRYSEGGTAVFPAGGVVALEALPPGPEACGLAADGADGVLAAGAFGASGTGVLRFQRVRGNGSRDFGLPGVAVDSDGAAKSSPVVARLGTGDHAVLWHRGGAGPGLRLQVYAAGVPRIADGGALLTSAADAAPAASVRAVGTSIQGYFTAAYGAGSLGRVLVGTASGAVVRDESVGDADEAPEITAVNAVVNGLPEGMEIRARRVDGSATRYVRPVAGAWSSASVVAAPSPAGPGAALSLAGPGWFFDLGVLEGRRVVAWREQGADTALSPVLGPWLAASPGDAPSVVRAAFAAGLVFTAWVGPDGAGDSVLVARAGGSGDVGVVEGRGLAPKSLTVKRPPSPKIARLAASAPTASLPAETDPDTGVALEPDLFRVQVGSEDGLAATLLLSSWKGKRGGAWKASVSGAGGTVTGSVVASTGGRAPRIALSGFPADAAQRIAWVRVELDDRVLGATVLLDPKGKTGVKAAFKGTTTK